RIWLAGGGVACTRSATLMLKSYWNRGVELLSLPFLLALLLSGGFMAFVAWDHSHWWTNREDYGFGWLVPAFVTFVVYDRWPRISAAAAACRAENSPRATGGMKWLLTMAAGLAMLGGALMFLLGAFYRAGAGP